LLRKESRLSDSRERKGKAAKKGPIGARKKRARCSTRRGRVAEHVLRKKGGIKRASGGGGGALFLRAGKN